MLTDLKYPLFWNSATEVLGLMLDYDGTLTPIVNNPTLAYMTPDRLALLCGLSRHPNIRLAIVSGRPLSQLLEFLGPLSREDVVFCGLHGGEIFHPQKNRKLKEPSDEHRRSLLELFKANLLRMLELSCLMSKGILLEDKHFSLALHFRMAPLKVQRQAKVIFEQVYAGESDFSAELKLQFGKQVVEVMPQAFHKGTSVDFLADYWSSGGQPLKLCYVGDDLTDEDAFDAVNAREGLSIRVGYPTEASHARHTVRDVAQLYQKMETLLICSIAPAASVRSSLEPWASLEPSQWCGLV